MKRQALRCVLSEKARRERLFCLDSMNTIDGKTKSMAQLLENLSVSSSALVVTKGTDRYVVQAASNIQKIWTLPVEQLNAQELLSKDLVIMTVEAARWVEETLSSEPHGRRGLKMTVGLAAADDKSLEEVASAEPATEPAATQQEETKPRPRRRRVATAESDVETTKVTEEEAPKPRTRRRRTAASADSESASQSIPDTPEGEA